MSVICRIYSTSHESVTIIMIAGTRKINTDGDKFAEQGFAPLVNTINPFDGYGDN